ncbi:TerD family protein [Streptomyces sp. NPDC057271]
MGVSLAKGDRHGSEWKFRAVGQGYASGLAVLATDFGVGV